jgi:hypothetical protein
MDEGAVIQCINDAFTDLDVVSGSSGYFFFRKREDDSAADHKFPFATLVNSDEYDQFSDLNRAGIYRLNIGLSRETYRSLFSSESTPETDFAALDKIMPHPVYAAMHWVCVLNPSTETFAEIKPLLTEAYERAAKRE